MKAGNTLARGRFLSASLVVLVLSAAGDAVAEDQSEPSQTVIVVVGAPGQSEYGKMFAQWAERWRSACRKGDARFIPIGISDQREVGGLTDKERLRKTLQEMGDGSTEPLWLVLIGHGTFDGQDAKFNLRGPDVTAEELSQWTASLKRPLALVQCASASAPFMKIMSGGERVVVTATKSGFEFHFTRFGDFLSRAVDDPSSDLDKDGQTSLLEAFLQASHQVAKYYSDQGQLATEHALLDDNGDGLGTPADWFRGVRPVKMAAEGADPDGWQANQWCLVRTEWERRLPAEVRTQRDELELKLARLRRQKGTLAEDVYYSRLEAIVSALADLYRPWLDEESAESAPAGLEDSESP